MAKYKVLYRKSAVKSIDRLPVNYLKLIRKHIIELSENPYLHGAIALKGYDAVYRLRVGRYRIIYQVLEEEITIIIIDVPKRDERTYKE